MVTSAVCAVLLLFTLELTVVSGAGSVSATGGGVIKVGQDLELTYTMEEEWERCYWYW